MSGPYRPYAKCTVVRIVFFMATGMILMALMILQPPQAVALASKIPSSLTIGGLIVGLGCLEFIRRLREHGKKNDPHY